MTEDGPRTARRPISTTKIEKWGLIEAWLAHDPRTREVRLQVGSTGFQVVVKRHSEESMQIVGPEEEVASAVLRAIGDLP